MRQDFVRLKVFEAKQDKDIKTGDIAKVLGISEGSTRNILLGRRGATEEEWRIICNVVGIDLDEINQAAMSGRLPGLFAVSDAWVALRSGKPYTRLEILKEELPPVSPDGETTSPGGDGFGQVPQLDFSRSPCSVP